METTPHLEMFFPFKTHLNMGYSIAMFGCQKVNIKQDPNFVAPLIPPKMRRLPN